MAKNGSELLIKNKKIRCPMQHLLELLTGPWTTYILWLLKSQGPQRLRMLENEEIISRSQQNTKPPQVVYGLSCHGKQLDAILDDG